MKAEGETVIAVSKKKYDVNKIREDFPILKKKVHGKNLVYLDNAATTQKPTYVIDKVNKYYTTMNANIHRGVHALSQEATEAFEGPSVLGLLCHVAGGFAPMYGAGRLERRNIVEYEDAARLAIAAGRPELLECLLTMAEVEWDHEQYFRSKVEGHALRRLFPPWSPPPPRASIREGYTRLPGQVA